MLCLGLLLVACCLLFVDCAWLFVVVRRGSFSVVCRLVFSLCRLLIVSCCLLVAVCCLVSDLRRSLLCVECCVWCLLSVG